MNPESVEACLAGLQELREKGRAVRIRGAGTRDSAYSGVQISTTNLRDVRFFQPEDMVIGIEAGMPFSQLCQSLDEKGMELPVNAWFENATIGGMVAASDFGPDRMFGGGIRDFLIGVEYINGACQKVKAGGRVVKNVTGYDASRMMIGSRGGLGCLTAVNFRLVPKKQDPRVVFQKLQGGSLKQLLEPVQALVTAKIPLDWVQLRGDQATWQVAFGYSGNQSRQQRLDQLFKQHLDDSWSDLSEEDLPETLAWAKVPLRRCGFLSPMKHQYTIPPWHFHVVAPTQCWHANNLQPAIQAGAQVVLNPIGGDAHFFFDSIKTPTESLDEVFAEISQWGWVECVAGPEALIEQRGHFFPLQSSHWLMLRLKRQLDPHNLFQSDFFELPR